MVGLPHRPALWLDVTYFQQRLAECQSHDHSPEEVCPTCLVSLTDAVNLYRDDFLTGFSLPDSPTFDDWQLFLAESLRRDLTDALERLIRGHAGQGEFKLLPGSEPPKRMARPDSLS